MGAAVKLKMTAVPRQQGERARLKVVRGPDYGVTFVIMGGRAVVGRGEENDIVISDLKASRQHAEFLFTQAGWQLRDLGSSNGILLNGKTVQTSPLRPKDTITLGETTFEFLTAEQPTTMLAAPPRSMEQVRVEESAFEEQRRKVRNLAAFGTPPGVLGAPAPAVGGASAGGGPRRLLVLGVIGVGAALLLFGGEEVVKKKPARKAAATQNSDLEKYLPADPAVQSKAAELFFKLGFREYTQGNFLRAKTQFETALQVAPRHAMAALYLQNCESRIKEEVDAHLRTGKKSLNSGKLREARAHFEQILRLLNRDQTNPHFIEAKEQLEAVRKQMRDEPEEVS